MRVLVGSAERGPVISSAVLVSALAVLALTVVAGLPLRHVAPVVILAVIAAVGYRVLLQWHVLVVATVLVILFVPIRRYALPGDLPFELEPYRVVVALVAAAWTSSLLIDPRVRLRRSGFEGPLLLFAFAALGSLVVNPGRVAAVEPDVVKNLMFFASFYVVFYVIVSVLRTPRHVDLLVTILVGGGAVMAVVAMIEARTGYNPFNHFSGVVPLLETLHIPDPPQRGPRLRVYASAQHPIALGAALVMLVPLALYLARRSGRARWWFIAAVLGMGAVSTVSRTSVAMFFVVAAVFLWLRPLETRRLLPLIIPALIAVHFAMPATLGPLKNSFFPQGGLIEEQRKSEGGRGSGRIADLGPSLRNEFAPRPLLGQGFGTRIVDRDRANALILDNQWLHSLLETGLAGGLALAWLFARAVRRFGRAAKEDISPRGWLLTGIAASVLAYAVGMFFYDAFAFVQVTFLLFILLALGSAVLSLPDARRPTETG
jgi:hypothetical protein